MSPAAGVLLDAVLTAAGGLPVRASVVGLCKNAGKTVTLNHIVAEAVSRGLPVGLASAGWDGEARDAITQLSKPPVRVFPGTCIATARGALDGATAGLTILQEVPGCHTVHGATIIARVTSGGEVVLAGPGSARRLRVALDALEGAARATRGRGLVLVDGALDRVAAAAPAITGVMVLAVGAAYHASMRVTLARTQHLLALAALPAPYPGQRHLLRQAFAGAPVSLVLPSGQVAALEFPSVLAQTSRLVAEVEERIAQFPSQGRDLRPLLAVSGAVTDALMETLLTRPGTASRICLAVPDPTHILTSDELWRRFARRGGRACVSHRITVAAVTTNPWSPAGPGYEPRALVLAVNQFAGGIPVMDLKAGTVLTGR